MCIFHKLNFQCTIPGCIDPLPLCIPKIRCDVKSSLSSVCLALLKHLEWDMLRFKLNCIMKSTNLMQICRWWYHHSYLIWYVTPCTLGCTFVKLSIMQSPSDLLFVDTWLLYLYSKSFGNWCSALYSSSTLFQTKSSMISMFIVMQGNRTLVTYLGRVTYVKGLSNSMSTICPYHWSIHKVTKHTYIHT